MKRQCRRRNSAIASRMAELGVTNFDLARAAGIHWTSVSRILNLRQNPRPATAHALAAALRTTPAQLGFGKGGGGDDSTSRC